jgi:DNA-binding response OmpR family regulator
MTGKLKSPTQTAPHGEKAVGAAVNAPSCYRIGLIDADAALLDLISEWLAGRGYTVGTWQSDAEPPPGRFDVVIVDMPFPRNRGVAVLARIRETHRETPIVALSSHFFPGIESAGAVARSLGVARVLPKPVAREALTAVVHALLDEQQ